MHEPKPFASLTAGLLARKGAARPAMRPQLVPPSARLPADLPPPTPAEEVWHDLGWNDMGAPADLAAEPALAPAEVVPITPATPVATVAEVPSVRRQQAAIAGKVARRSRRSALAEGRRAAFTLRLDSDRHIKLRLACTLHNRSAQLLITEALDRLFADEPALCALAAQMPSRR